MNNIKCALVFIACFITILQTDVNSATYNSAIYISDFEVSIDCSDNKTIENINKICEQDLYCAIGTTMLIEKYRACLFNAVRNNQAIAHPSNTKYHESIYTVILTELVRATFEIDKGYINYAGQPLASLLRHKRLSARPMKTSYNYNIQQYTQSEWNYFFLVCAVNNAVFFDNSSLENVYDEIVKIDCYNEYTNRLLKAKNDISEYFKVINFKELISYIKNMRNMIDCWRKLDEKNENYKQYKNLYNEYDKLNKNNIFLEYDISSKKEQISNLSNKLNVERKFLIKLKECLDGLTNNISTNMPSDEKSCKKVFNILSSIKEKLFGDTNDCILNDMHDIYNGLKNTVSCLINDVEDTKDLAQLRIQKKRHNLFDKYTNSQIQIDIDLIIDKDESKNDYKTLIDKIYKFFNKFFKQNQTDIENLKKILTNAQKTLDAQQVLENQAKIKLQNTINKIRHQTLSNEMCCCIKEFNKFEWNSNDDMTFSIDYIQNDYNNGKTIECCNGIHYKYHIDQMKHKIVSIDKRYYTDIKGTSDRVFLMDDNALLLNDIDAGQIEDLINFSPKCNFDAMVHLLRTQGKEIFKNENEKIFEPLSQLCTKITVLDKIASINGKKELLGYPMCLAENKNYNIYKEATDIRKIVAGFGNDIDNKFGNFITTLANKFNPDEVWQNYELNKCFKLMRNIMSIDKRICEMENVN